LNPLHNDYPSITTIHKQFDAIHKELAAGALLFSGYAPILKTQTPLIVLSCWLWFLNFEP
jgi:hypothetical protein